MTVPAAVSAATASGVRSLNPAYLGAVLQAMCADADGDWDPGGDIPRERNPSRTRRARRPQAS